MHAVLDKSCRRRLYKRIAIKHREKRIAIANAGVDAGEVEAVDEAQCFAINSRSATDHEFVGAKATGELDSLVDTPD